MSEQDALSTFDFNKVGGGGLFVKWEAGKPLTLRVLTTDPVVQQQEFEGDEGTQLSTKFCFVVYNFTDGRAQILSATPGIARKIGALHVDPDFGSNIRKIDLKITPSGEKLTRKYDIQVLPTAKELTNDMIAEAQKIDLDAKIEDGSRMSLWTPPVAKVVEEEAPPALDDVADVPDSPISLDDIPF
jgi:hypothetical protein